MASLIVQNRSSPALTFVKHALVNVDLRLRKDALAKQSNIYQRDPQISALPATQARRRLDDRDLQRGSDVTAEKVTSPHAAVTESEHGMEVQAGLAVVSLRDVAEQTQYFALLIDGDRRVSFGREIKPSTSALSNAPIAATDAALMAFSSAKAVTAANASSP
jgi:hypothetical protein